jgi:hypothetical protein
LRAARAHRVRRFQREQRLVAVDRVDGRSVFASWRVELLAS